jgi:hypothetical protein
MELIYFQVDMEKLADNLQRLGEDDLLHVVEMVHNNKTADTYTKNDVERKPTPSIPPDHISIPFSTPERNPTNSVINRRGIPCGSLHSPR